MTNNEDELASHLVDELGDAWIAASVDALRVETKRYCLSVIATAESLALRRDNDESGVVTPHEVAAATSSLKSDRSDLDAASFRLQWFGALAGVFLGVAGSASISIVLGRELQIWMIAVLAIPTGAGLFSLWKFNQIGSKKSK